MDDAVNNGAIFTSLRPTPARLLKSHEWLTREMFREFTRNQTEIGILFSGSRQGLFINRVEAAMSKCISESDPSFDADVVRKIVLSFCVQGCYYTFTSYCGQMDEKRLVALLASIARAAQKIRM